MEKNDLTKEMDEFLNEYWTGNFQEMPKELNVELYRECYDYIIKNGYPEGHIMYKGWSFENALLKLLYKEQLIKLYHIALINNHKQSRIWKMLGLEYYYQDMFIETIFCLKKALYFGSDEIPDASFELLGSAYAKLGDAYNANLWFIQSRRIGINYVDSFYGGILDYANIKFEKPKSWGQYNSAIFNIDISLPEELKVPLEEAEFEKKLFNTSLSEEFKIRFEEAEFEKKLFDTYSPSILSPTATSQEVNSQFTIDQLNDRILTATFVGLGRPDDTPVYFDKLEGDVLSYMQGYLSSLVADRSTEDLRFVNRIRNRELEDYVDEDRYILIDRLPLTKFLKEYKKQTKGKEPFLSFADYFSVKTLERYHWYDFYENDEDFNDSGYNEDQCVTIKDLTIGSNLYEEFSMIFGEKYPDRFDELVSDFRNIFDSTMKAVAFKWIRKNVFK